VIDLIDEFLALSPPRVHERTLSDNLVGLQVRLLAGGVHEARAGFSGRFWQSEPEGEPVVVVPVYDGPVPNPWQEVEEPILLDLLAFDPRRPTRWWLRRAEHGLVLGEGNLRASLYMQTECPAPVVHETPLEWLREGCRGICPLDKAGVDRLRDLPRLAVADEGLAARLEAAILREPRIPEIEVLATP
jgi:hypothetical protein